MLRFLLLQRFNFSLFEINFKGIGILISAILFIFSLDQPFWGRSADIIALTQYPWDKLFQGNHLSLYGIWPIVLKAGITLGGNHIWIPYCIALPFQLALLREINLSLICIPEGKWILFPGILIFFLPIWTAQWIAITPFVGLAAGFLYLARTRSSSFSIFTWGVILGFNLLGPEGSLLAALGVMLKTPFQKTYYCGFGILGSLMCWFGYIYEMDSFQFIEKGWDWDRYQMVLDFITGNGHWVLGGMGLMILWQSQGIILPKISLVNIFFYILSVFIIIIHIISVDIFNPLGLGFPLICLAFIFCAKRWSTLQLRFKSVWAVAILIGALSGNIWGNTDLGHHSLLSYTWVYGKEDLKNLILTSGLKPDNIGAAWPLTYPGKITHLNGEEWKLAPKDLDRQAYIFYSNLCSDFSTAEIKRLEREWRVVEDFSHGSVVFLLYQNPEQVPVNNDPKEMAKLEVP